MSRRCAYRFVFALAVISVVGVGCPTPPPSLLGPTAAFSVSSVEGNVPLRVQFIDQSQPGESAIVSWQWNFGDGTTSTLRNPSHTYFLPGTYTVSLTVTSGVGSNTLTRPNLVEASEPATAEGIGSAGGRIEDGGASLVVPAGILEDTVVFILAPGEGKVPVVAAENEEVVSEVFTLAQTYGSFISGPAHPMVLTIPFSPFSIPSFHQNSEHLMILASLPDGITIPIPASVDGTTLVADISGLPAQAAYAVVYRPLVDTVAVSPTEAKLAWTSGTWRVYYSPLSLQELTALRVGTTVDVVSYDRRNWSQAQLATTLTGLRNTLSEQHQTAKEAGFVSPSLITNEDDEFSLVFYHLANTPLPSYGSVDELTYTTSIFGSIIVDPAQLIDISKHNALSVPDRVQEMGLANAMAQELYRSIFRGYKYLPYSTPVAGESVVFFQGLEDSLVTYLGQISDDLEVRSLGPNEYARLDETLFAPYSSSMPLYSYSGQDFLAYLMLASAPADPFIFLGDAYQGVLSLVDIKLSAPGVDTFAEAMTAMREATHEAIDLSFGQSLAGAYWDYATDRAYENSSLTVLRPSDSARVPFTLNTSRFAAGSIVDVNIDSAEEEIEITSSGHPGLANVPPMTTRVILLDATGVNGDLTVSANWDNWFPDILGNSVNIKVYRNGANGTEITEDNPSVLLEHFGATSGQDAFTRAVIIISNVSLDMTYSLGITAEVTEDHVITTGSLGGTVVAFGTSAPIAGATVQVRREGSQTVVATTTTNALGQYEIPNLLAGNITVTFSKNGYLTSTPFSRAIVAGEKTTLNTVLVAL